jgi:hypothetical protein
LFSTPGDHWTLVKEPYVKVLCQQLESYL